MFESYVQIFPVWNLYLLLDNCMAFFVFKVDGRSSYNSLLQLMSLIEKVYTFPVIYASLDGLRPKNTKLLPSKEEVYKKSRQYTMDQYLSNVFLKTPSFLDSKNAHLTSYSRLKYLSDQEEQGGMVYNHDGTPFISVKRLNEISKMANSKFRTLIIDQEDMKKILKKCKENGTKVTSFLNMVMVLSLKLIYMRCV